MGVYPSAAYLLWGMGDNSGRFGANDRKAFASALRELHGRSKCLRRAGGFVAVLHDRRLPSLARALCHWLGRLLARDQQEHFADGPRSVERPLATTRVYRVRLSLCASSRRRRVCCGQVRTEGNRIADAARLISSPGCALQLPRTAVRDALPDMDACAPRHHRGEDPNHADMQR